MARWNLVRLAQAISPLFASGEALQAGIDGFGIAYSAADRDNIARKLGLETCRDDDVVLIRDLHASMHAAEVDMTLWFRALMDIDIEAPTLAPFEHAFYDEQSATRMRRSSTTGCSATPRGCAKTR